MNKKIIIPLALIIFSLGAIVILSYCSAWQAGIIPENKGRFVRGMLASLVDAQTSALPGLTTVTTGSTTQPAQYTVSSSTITPRVGTGTTDTAPVTSETLKTETSQQNPVVQSPTTAPTSKSATTTPITGVYTAPNSVGTTTSSAASVPTDTTTTTSTGTSTTQGTVRYIPPVIIEPADGAKFTSGNVQFSVRAVGATSVEFFYRQTNSGSDAIKYLKKASYAQNSIWKLLVPENNLPNGDYELIARAYLNSGGTLETNPVHFAISFPVDSVQALAKTNINSSETSGASIDSDGDGLSDDEEKRLGTDPYNPDSDQDGYLDGDEVKSGYDPLKLSYGNKEDRIVFQSPKEIGDADQRYMVENVSVVDSGQQGTPQSTKTLRINGKALPNMFVTLYIYSDSPIVITVKTDENGNWSYDLDKNLEDGEHQVYVAVTDNTGKITAKSQPLSFIKTAEAATVVASTGDNGPGKTASPMAQKKNAYLSIALIIMAVFLSIALLLIGVVAYRHQKDEIHHQ